MRVACCVSLVAFVCVCVRVLFMLRVHFACCVLRCVCRMTNIVFFVDNVACACCVAVAAAVGLRCVLWGCV